MSSEEWSGISSILNILIAALTAGVAIWSVTQWRAEMKDRTEYECAKRILTLIHLISFAVKNVRSRPPADWEASSRPEKDCGAIDHHRDLNYTYDMRWAKVQAHLAELNVALSEGKALWGGMLIERSQALASLLNEVG